MIGDASPGEARGDSTFGRLEAADAAVFETFVVPRYLRPFGELAVEMLVASDEAQVAPAIELARAKAATTPELSADYRLSHTEWPAPFPAAAFSHALALHPLARPAERMALLTELARLLAPHGQALIAMPLRGSFPEIADLLREYALKSEAVPLSDAVDRASFGRPTVELLGAELEQAGFGFVDVELRTSTLEWRSGRDFHEDPVARLILFPEFRAQLGVDDLERAWDYVREAIDKYWSDGTFELTVNVGCASGRKIP
jgi:SAM-dependent methyltransferase